MNPLIFTLFPFAFSDSVTTKIDTKKLFLDIIHRQLFLLMLNFKSRVKNTVSIVTLWPIRSSTEPLVCSVLEDMNLTNKRVDPLKLDNIYFRKKKQFSKGGGLTIDQPEG